MTMTTTTPRMLAETTPRRAGIIAGIGYLMLFVFAIFGNFLVLESLIVPDDAAATVANLAESGTTFRFGILAFLVIFLVDVVVAWALYVLLSPYAQRLSLAMAWMRIVYTVMLGVGIVFLMAASGLVQGATTDVDQVALMLDGFDYSWMIGLAAFGLHLGLLGYILIRTRVAPRLLGVLVVVAGIAYVADTTFFTVLSDYESYADAFLIMVAVPSVIAELGLAIWLLARAGKELPVAASDDADLARSAMIG